MLTRVQILQSAEPETQTVNVPEWGGDIQLKGLNVAELGTFRKLVETHGPEKRDACIIAVAAIDGDGHRLFADEDVPALAAKSGPVISRIVDVAAGLSGMSGGGGGTGAKNG